MSITYKQIIDLHEMNVYAYLARLNLVNYDVDINMVDKVLERRGLEDLLDRYLIQHTFMELKNFYNETHAYLKVCIPIHEKTLLSDTILSFILTQFDFFKIPKENVIFICENSKKIAAASKLLIKNGIEVASNQLELVYQDAISYYLLEYHTYKAAYKEIFNSCSLRKINIIVSDVNNKEDLQKQKEINSKYIYGNHYKKNIKMNELINVVLSNK